MLFSSWDWEEKLASLYLTSGLCVTVIHSRTSSYTMDSHLPWLALWKGSVSRWWGPVPARAPSRAVSRTSQGTLNCFTNWPFCRHRHKSHNFMFFLLPLPFLLLSFPLLAASPLSSPSFFLGLPFPLFSRYFSFLSLTHHSVYMDTFKSWQVHKTASLKQAVNLLLR